MRVTSYKPWLACGGILILALALACTGFWFAINRIQKAPEALAQLNSLPMYPTAQDVQLLQKGNDQQPAVVTYRTTDKPRLVFDFYRQELESSGWVFFEPGSRPDPEVDWFGKSDTILGGYEFSGFDGQGVGAPFIRAREYRIESLLQVEVTTTYTGEVASSSVRLQMEVTDFP